MEEPRLVIIAHLSYRDDLVDINASGPIGLMRGLAREIAYAYPKVNKPLDKKEVK